MPDRDALASAIAFYQRFVEYCEDDCYPLGGDDYTNELSTRDWLEESAAQLNEEERTLIHELDERYVRATDDDGGELLGSHFNIGHLGWWWRRRPRAALEELHEDWGVPLNPRYVNPSPRGAGTNRPAGS